MRSREDSDSEGDSDSDTDDDEEDDDDEVLEEEQDSGDAERGYLSRKRKSYTIKTKRGYLKRIGECKVDGVLQREACQLEGMHESLCHQWRIAVSTIDEGEEEETPETTKKIHLKLKSLSRRLGSGCRGLLKEHTEILLQFVFKLQEQGHGVSTNMVARKAGKICCNFREKTEEAQ